MWYYNTLDTSNMSAVSFGQSLRYYLLSYDNILQFCRVKLQISISVPVYYGNSPRVK